MALTDSQVQDAIIELFKLIGVSRLPSELQTIAKPPTKDHYLHIQKGEADGERITVEWLRGALGAYNATTNTPILQNGTGTEGDSYIVSAAGARDFGNGLINLSIDDVLAYRNGKWVRTGFALTKQTILDTLGFIPEDTANRGITYPTLDENRKVPISQTYGGTSEVIEGEYIDPVTFNDDTGTPVTPTKSVIYLDKVQVPNAQYRWGGTQFIKTIQNPGSTDEVAEGDLNLYFTTARVLETLLAGLSTANVPINSADTAITALGKLQGQISALAEAIATSTDFTIQREPDFASFPLEGFEDTLYVDEAENKAYLWDDFEGLYFEFGGGYELTLAALDAVYGYRAADEYILDRAGWAMEDSLSFSYLFITDTVADDYSNIGNLPAVNYILRKTDGSLRFAVKEGGNDAALSNAEGVFFRLFNRNSTFDTNLQEDIYKQGRIGPEEFSTVVGGFTWKVYPFTKLGNVNSWNFLESQYALNFWRDGSANAEVTAQAITDALGGAPALDSEVVKSVNTSDGTPLAKVDGVVTLPEFTPTEDNTLNTLADLKAIEGVAGDYYYILGRETPGDGLIINRPFYWDAVSTKSDNNSTVIKATGVEAGRWIANTLNIDYISYKFFADYQDDTVLLQDMFDLLFNSEADCTLDLEPLRIYDVAHANLPVYADSIYKYTGVFNKQINGNNAIINDLRTRTQIGTSNYDGVIGLNNSHNISILNLDYQNLNEDYDITTEIGEIGTSFIILHSDCSNIEVVSNVIGARYGIKSGDFSEYWLCGNYGIKDSKFNITASSCGYPVAIEVGKNLEVNVYSELHRRAAYLCGISNSKIHIESKDTYIAPAHCILSDSRYSDTEGFPKYKSCSDLDVTVKDTGTTIATNGNNFLVVFQSYNQFSERVVPLVWDNINIVCGKEKEAPTMGLFSFEQNNVNTSPSNIPDVYSNINIKGLDLYNSTQYDARISPSQYCVYKNIKFSIVAPLGSVLYDNANSEYIEINNTVLNTINVAGNISVINSKITTWTKLTSNIGVTWYNGRLFRSKVDVQPSSVDTLVTDFNSLLAAYTTTTPAGSPNEASIIYDETLKLPKIWNKTEWLRYDGMALKLSQGGTYPTFPAGTNRGFQFYHTPDANRLGVWDGFNWKHTPLFRVDKFVGTTAERPMVSSSSVFNGVPYFDTTLNKPVWWTGTQWTTYLDENNPNLDFVRKSTTNLGKTGSLSANSAISVSADWSNLPIGYSSLIAGSVGTAKGAPVNEAGYFTKISNRDTSGGWSGLWVSYSTNKLFIGQADSNTVFATWNEIPNKGQVEAIVAAVKEHQINGTRIENAAVTGTYNIDYNAASLWILTLTGATTLTESNIPEGTKAIELEINGDFPLDVPTRWVKKPSSQNYLGTVKNSFLVSSHSTTRAVYSLENLA